MSVIFFPENGQEPGRRGHPGRVPGMLQDRQRHFRFDGRLRLVHVTFGRCSGEPNTTAIGDVKKLLVFVL